MSITVIKEGSVLRILDGAGAIPDGTRLVLVPAKAVDGMGDPLEQVQLETAFREDQEDWGNLLDPLVISPLSAQGHGHPSLS